MSEEHTMQIVTWDEPVQFFFWHESKRFGSHKSLHYYWSGFLSLQHQIKRIFHPENVLILILFNNSVVLKRIW